MCNFIEDTALLRDFALENGFHGIDWSFDMSNLPETPLEASRWATRISTLAPLEVRFHCPFPQLDIGHEDPSRQQAAVDIFEGIIRLVSKGGGRYLTIHVGLGHDTTRVLSWESTISRLRDLVLYGESQNVVLCLENLAWGWTSKPNLFEKLIRHSGAGVTFDIGHARACEAVRSRQYGSEDFVSPHMERVANAHVYHDEIEGVGHVPPKSVSDIADRLDILVQSGCPWWTLEIRETEGLAQTKGVVDDYLNRFSAESPETPA